MAEVVAAIQGDDRMKFNIVDAVTHDYINTIEVADEDELIEQEEIAETLGFYLEEVC